jgi:hypothetical protein
MWCGAPATGYSEQEFRRMPVAVAVCFLVLAVFAGLVISEIPTHHSELFGPCFFLPWVFVLGGAGWLLLLLSAQSPGSRMTVSAPLCSAHRRHWRNRQWWLVTGSVVLAVCTVGGMNVAGVVMPRLSRIQAGLVFVPAALFGFIVLRTCIKYSGIHARKISSADIVLENVHPLFLVALREQQEARRQAEMTAAPLVPPDDDRIRARPPDPVRRDDRPQ